jgi:hypothetical protein
LHISCMLATVNCAGSKRTLRAGFTSGAGTLQLK